MRTVLTVCFTVLAVAALVEFLLHTQLALFLTLGAAMLAVALNHAVDALVQRRIRRGLAIAVVAVALLALLVALGFLLIPPAISQARSLAAEAPALWRKLQETKLFLFLDQRFDLQEQLKQFNAKAADAVTPMLSAVGGFLSGVAAALTLVVLTIFVLIFGPELAAAGFALIRPEARARAEHVAAKIYRSIGGYIGGLLGICAINAALTTVFLAVTRMPFFLPLAILSGFSSLVPYAGPLVAGVSITLMALVVGGPIKALITGIYFILYGQLEGNVLGPVIYKRVAHVNPLVTMLAILFFAEFMGLAGAVVAVPLAATAQIIVREIVALREERDARGAVAREASVGTGALDASASGDEGRIQ
ncbi:MAG: AI-2E family transporter [Myxococcales bacterium]